MRLQFSRKILEKCSEIKFHVNPSSGGRAVLYRWTVNEQTDMTKLTVAFRNFVNAPNIQKYQKVLPSPRAKLDQYIDDTFQTRGFYVPILFDNKFTYITDPKAGCVVRDVQRGRMSVE